jgi:hypothetical protein
MDDLDRGVQFIQQHKSTFQQLSVPYRDEVTNVTVEHLSEQWHKAEQTFWPMSWLGRRKVYKELANHIQGKHKPDVATDLPKIQELRKLDAAINELNDLVGKTSGLWAGENQVE